MFPQKSKRAVAMATIPDSPLPQPSDGVSSAATPTQDKEVCVSTAECEGRESKQQPDTVVKSTQDKPESALNPEKSSEQSESGPSTDTDSGQVVVSSQTGTADLTSDTVVMTDDKQLAEKLCLSEETIHLAESKINSDVKENSQMNVDVNHTNDTPTANEQILETTNQVLENSSLPKVVSVDDSTAKYPSNPAPDSQKRISASSAGLCKAKEAVSHIGSTPFPGLKSPKLARISHDVIEC